MTVPAPRREDMERALDCARRTVAELEAALGCTTRPRFNLERLVPVKAVARQFQRSAETVRAWCRDLAVGVEIGGTWYVDLGRLDDHINRPSDPATIAKTGNFRADDPAEGDQAAPVVPANNTGARAGTAVRATPKGR